MLFSAIVISFFDSLMLCLLGYLATADCGEAKLVLEVGEREAFLSCLGVLATRGASAIFIHQWFESAFMDSIILALGTLVRLLETSGTAGSSFKHFLFPPKPATATVLTADSDLAPAAMDLTATGVDFTTAGDDFTTAGDDFTTACDDFMTAGDEFTAADVDFTTMGDNVATVVLIVVCIGLALAYGLGQLHCVSLTALRQTLGDFEGGDIDLTVDLKGLTTKAGDLGADLVKRATSVGLFLDDETATRSALGGRNGDESPPSSEKFTKSGFLSLSDRPRDRRGRATISSVPASRLSAILSTWICSVADCCLPRAGSVPDG